MALALKTVLREEASKAVDWFAFLDNSSKVIHMGAMFLSDRIRRYILCKSIAEN